MMRFPEFFRTLAAVAVCCAIAYGASIGAEYGARAGWWW